MGDYFVLLVNGLTGVIFVIAGLFVYLKPSKKINQLYGYRTPQSMSTQKKWDFSQTYSGKLMTKAGGLMILLGLLDIVITFSDVWITILAIAPTLLVCLILFVLTESKMKQMDN